MRTLVVSDLHLGSRLARDVLRAPAARAALTTALEDVERLVLLGDVVELLEGRPGEAMDVAVGVLDELGDALGREREVVIVPGNHDHVLVRPWLRAQRERGRLLGLERRVGMTSSPLLERLALALRPARVSVRYPGVRLGDGVYATHGHYVDRHLLPPVPLALARGPFAPLPAGHVAPEDYERAAGPSLAAVSNVLSTALPRSVGEPIDVLTGAVRRMGIAAVPVAAALPGVAALAPLSAGALVFQFPRLGLPAMAEVAGRLRVEARHVIFGHLHRAGPLAGDPPDEWRPDPDGPLLHNSGCWVYEPLLLAGAQPPHPYWPGAAVLVAPGEAPRTVTLLDDVPEPELRGPA